MAQNPTEQFNKYRDGDPDEAKFFWNGGPVQLAERTWFQSQLSGCVGFETDDGLVLVDTGTKFLAPVLAKRLREKTQAPVHTAIYTHGHVDHAFGLDQFLIEGQPRPRVVAHRAVMDRFRRYDQTSGHNSVINARQFGGDAAAAEGGQYSLFTWPTIPPDTLYEDQMILEVGGLTFELYHCRGETDDHTWVYNPERGVLCPGDLFIYGVPNAGNPQKAQRYPWDWADGLRRMAAKEPRSIGPGHGGPVVNDPAKVKRMLLETADYLDTIVEQTIRALNSGSPPHVDIVHAVEVPTSDSPWLYPVYDEAEFIVRNVIRYYGGWWNGRPSDLKPAPREDVAREIASLVGTPARLAERARELAEKGELRLAGHLADYALEADPDDATVREVVAALYDQRSEVETSLMAVNLFNSAANYARAGKRFK
jgi:glyoxylase-like metal-dependent hydrolase (beta-lactamase superfamily II)